MKIGNRMRCDEIVCDAAKHLFPSHGSVPAMIAASILDKGLQAPIRVTADGARFVLVEGLHRLEAAKALGEQTIAAFLVDARRR
jgi:hypothetical protein